MRLVFFTHLLNISQEKVEVLFLGGFFGFGWVVNPGGCGFRSIINVRVTSNRITNRRRSAQLDKSTQSVELCGWNSLHVVGHGGAMRATFKRRDQGNRSVQEDPSVIHWQFYFGGGRGRQGCTVVVFNGQLVLILFLLTHVQPKFRPAKNSNKKKSDIMAVRL